MGVHLLANLVPCDRRCLDRDEWAFEYAQLYVYKQQTVLGPTDHRVHRVSLHFYTRAAPARLVPLGLVVGIGRTNRNGSIPPIQRS